MNEQYSLFLNQPASYSVTEINAYIRELMEMDETLQDLWVQGEVSNLSRPKSGHLYFTVKDRAAALRCVMWRGQASRLDYQPRDGDAVEVHGSISVYEASGQYQLYVDKIRPAGEGALYQQFLELKNKLEGEGLFDPERKRPLPYLPKTIGIVTSPTGAALRDMLNTLRRRFPLVEVILAPVTVQGDAAPAEIVAGIETLNEHTQPDLILLARGGGSIEDLSAFNAEIVARAIAASNTPVICGVGHETDFTISDFVADLRAPTPTAAAELAVPDQSDILSILRERKIDLAGRMLSILKDQRWELQSWRNQLERRSPAQRLGRERQRLDEINFRIQAVLKHSINLKRTQLQGIGLNLRSLNPRQVLSRGYAVVTGPKGLVRKKQDLLLGDAIQVQVSDGSFAAQVTENDEQEK